MRALEFKSFLDRPIGNSKDFTWSEAIYLNKWQIHVMPESPDVISAIELTAERMQKIRDLFNEPIRVTSWFRPLVYNEEIGGAKRSSHLSGMACDFIVKGISSDDVRALLLNRLNDFNMRMENLDGANWVHIDINCTPKFTLEQRYFKP